jgi:hypothetical protein
MTAVLVLLGFVVVYIGLLWLVSRRWNQITPTAADWERYCRRCPRAAGCTSTPTDCEWARGVAE